MALGAGALALVRVPAPAPMPLEVWLAVHEDIRHTPRIRAVTEFVSTALRQRTAILNPG